MKWRPILFTNNMVTAIRSPTNPKAQTRRLVKFHKPFTESRHWEVALPDGFGGWIFWDKTGPDIAKLVEFQERAYPHGGGMRCPYGQKGDYLWVKETHYLFGHWVKDGVTKAGKQKWRFFPELRPSVMEPDVLYEDFKPFFSPAEVRTKKTERGWFKRPSLFMPKWAARTFLELTEDPRPERLQSISGRDAYAEGVIVSHDPIPVGLTWEETVGSAAVAAYERLWDSINSNSNRWGFNPWIWRLEFRRIEKEEYLAKRH